ncbi:hypothetical protein [Nocardioides currus]|uniref:TolB-like translocation protein n=1 Tax=Nocardioides currus TaxID=2133958 RepID=A0A2R7Z134_9ACTN|nr:hypothetical protein [Nocardioides currus]PUA82338.1 hypothetical protein C7S10_00870 [Nocardioides currus]
MSRRVLVFVVVCVVSLGGATAYAVSDLDRYRDEIADAPALDTAPASSFADGPRIVFRNTAIGPDYGKVATVALDDPHGPRDVTDLDCDRIDVVPEGGSCLQSDPGVVTRYRWLDLDADLDEVDETPLVGMPSRTRLSPDGSMVASTVFVAGHSYSQVGFSTATVVREVGGSTWGNLEKFQLVMDGKAVRPADRNVWGVTFDRTGPGFYATVATGGTPYLVRGDLEARTLTTVRAGAECPAQSPDGTRVAYKKDIGKDLGEDTVHWAIAVLDLASGKETVLDAEDRSVDDQVQWLDDDTLLYALPRDDDPGTTDVWELAADGSSAPDVLIEQAWSPAVVRTS